MFPKFRRNWLKNSNAAVFYGKKSFIVVVPGLMVMGDDSCSKGLGFESQCHILDGHLDIFSHWFVVKFVLFVWKDRKLTKKRPGLANFLTKICLWHLLLIRPLEKAILINRFKTVRKCLTLYVNGFKTNSSTILLSKAWKRISFILLGHKSVTPTDRHSC